MKDSEQRWTPSIGGMDMKSGQGTRRTFVRCNSCKHHECKAGKPSTGNSFLGVDAEAVLVPRAKPSASGL
jgi:hypothetical protein